MEEEEEKNAMKLSPQQIMKVFNEMLSRRDPGPHPESDPAHKKVNSIMTFGMPDGNKASVYSPNQTRQSAAYTSNRETVNSINTVERVDLSTPVSVVHHPHSNNETVRQFIQATDHLPLPQDTSVKEEDL